MKTSRYYSIGEEGKNLSWLGLLNWYFDALENFILIKFVDLEQPIQPEGGKM